MASITTRQTAGTGATVNNAPLTNTQVDNNFININVELGEKVPRVSGTTGAALIPAGTTGQRPGSPVLGSIRYNTITNEFEGWAGSTPAWTQIGGAQGAVNLASGTTGLLPIASGGTGTATAADARTALGVAALSHTHSAAEVGSGTFTIDRIPDLTAAKITSGTFSAGQIPDLPTSKITSGVFDSSFIPVLNANKITTGSLLVGVGGTGRTTLTAGAYLKGDGTNAVAMSSTIPSTDVIPTTQIQKVSDAIGNFTTTGNIEDVSKLSLLSNKNYIVNGDFTVWPRGNYNSPGFTIGGTLITDLQNHSFTSLSDQQTVNMSDPWTFISGYFDLRWWRGFFTAGTSGVVGNILPPESTSGTATVQTWQTDQFLEVGSSVRSNNYLHVEIKSDGGSVYDTGNWAAGWKDFAFQSINTRFDIEDELFGNQITLSFWAKGSLVTSTASFMSGTSVGTEVPNTMRAVLNITGISTNANAQTTFIMGDVLLTTSWKKYVYTITLPALTTSNSHHFTNTKTGTLSFAIGAYNSGVAPHYNGLKLKGNNSYIDFARVKLEVGSVATPFQKIPYNQEYLNVSRYFQCSAKTAGQMINDEPVYFQYPWLLPANYWTTSAPSGAANIGRWLSNVHREYFGIDSASTAGTRTIKVKFHTPMKATPGITLWDMGGYKGFISTYNGAGTRTDNVLAVPTVNNFHISTTGFSFDVTGHHGVGFYWAAAVATSV